MSISNQDGKGKRSLWRRIKSKYFIFVDKLYRMKYLGKGDTLGFRPEVSWRYELPPAEQDKQGRNLSLRFSDPRTNGLVGSARLIVGFNKEYKYLEYLQWHEEDLKRRGFILAEPDDPKGFFVKFARG